MFLKCFKQTMQHRLERKKQKKLILTNIVVEKVSIRQKNA